MRCSSSNLVDSADSLFHRSAHLKSLLSSLPRPLLGLLLVAMALPPALLAQTTSTIEGTVTDRQGLAVSGAEVNIAADTLGVSKKTTTDANGNYSIAALPAGLYALTVSHLGFSTQVLKDLEVTLDRKSTRLNSSHPSISYAVFCLKKKK